MPATRNSIMQDWFDNVWNNGDETTIDRLFRSDGVIHGLPSPDGQPLRGPEAFKPFHRSLRTAFPDISIEVVHEVTEGDLTVAHCRVRGTHAGDGLGIPATNRSVEFWGFTLGRVVDGQMVEGWNSYDFLTMYEQLGVPLNVPGRRAS